MLVLDIFSGIGAFSLGLERAGMKTVAFCETDPFCRRVLAKHWPGTLCYDDVRTLTYDQLRSDDIRPDVICGGFPCQDISVAGRGAGIDGERSGLWTEFARLIGEIQPRYAVVENVAALLGRGLGDVLGNLASLGYDAEWHCIPASAVGAPHIRDRIWIVAYPNQSGLEGRNSAILSECSRECTFGQSDTSKMADTECTGLQGTSGSWVDRGGRTPIVSASLYQSVRGQWKPEPDVGRVATRITSRVDRLRSLGNSLVPQIPEMIGRAILEAEAAKVIS